MYELVSLRQPYEGQEQMKDCIFEGQKPFLSEKVGRKIGFHINQKRLGHFVPVKCFGSNG